MDSSELFGADSDLSDVDDERQEDAVMEEEEEPLDDGAAVAIKVDDRDDDEWVAPDKKKRERSDSVDAVPAAAKRKRKGRKPKLESFAALPLDLLEADVGCPTRVPTTPLSEPFPPQICSHLDLEAIYYLSLVNKQLNAFLATSKSKPLWIAARETSGLPELKAEGFNELQYAQLMFGLGCSFCGATKDRTHKVDYLLRMRACPDCVEASFVTYQHLYSQFTRLRGMHGMLTPAPRGYNQTVYALSEIQYWEQAIEYVLEDDASFSASYTWARTARPGYDDAREALEIVSNEQKAAIDLQDEADARAVRRSNVEALYTEIAKETEAIGAAGPFPLPCLSEFLELQSVKALWHPSDADNVASLPCDAIAAELLVLSHLFEAGKSDGSPLPIPDDDGACNRCGYVDAFPSILSHDCLSQQKASFNPGVYVVTKLCLERCRKLLEITSLEEATTTWADVETLGNRFSCVSCKPPLGTCCLTWKEMMRHMYNSPQGDENYCHLVLHTSDEEVQAKFLELCKNWKDPY